MDLEDGFFLQNDPIPQSKSDKEEEVNKADKESANEVEELGTFGDSTAAPTDPDKTLQSQKPQNTHPQGSLAKPPREENAQGRGRGQNSMMHGRGRGRGFLVGPRGLRLHVEDSLHEHCHLEEEEEEYSWAESPDGEFEPWQPEEHHFHQDEEEEYYDQSESYPPLRGPHRHWEEGGPLYWAGRRPPIPTHRPPFPHDGPRRPPFQPRFLPHGPRRPPPSPGDLLHDPCGPVPPHHMGPRFRRGMGSWGPTPSRLEMVGRGRRCPVPPGYNEAVAPNSAWTHPRARGPRHPAPPPHEPMRRPLLRPSPGSSERWRRPSLPHEDPIEYEEEFPKTFGLEDGLRIHPPQGYRHQGYSEEGPEDWRQERPEPEFPHRWKPDDHSRPTPFRNEEQFRPEHRGPDYQEHLRSDWNRSPPLPERVYPPGPREQTSSMYNRNFDPGVALLSSAPGAPPDEASPGKTKAVVALSQRQHEIILRAAQELKRIRYGFIMLYPAVILEQMLNR